MGKERRHEIASITLRYVKEAYYFGRSRHVYYPSCRRATKREDCRFSSIWNVRYDYKTHSVRGGGQSMYWCDVCLPEKYRRVADSMLRGMETSRVLTGAAMKRAGLADRPDPTTPPAVAMALRAGPARSE